MERTTRTSEHDISSFTDQKNQNDKLSIYDVPTETFSYNAALLGLANNNDQAPAQKKAKEDELQMKQEDEELQLKPEEPALIQHKSDRDEENKVQLKKGNPTFHLGRTNPVQAKMPEEVQAKMESSFGVDFSNVNIHKDSASATQMGAQAYAQGNDVHFAPGKYNPNTQGGQELLAHELTHVVQQRQGRVNGTQNKGGANINNDPSLENEADVMGAKAAKGQSAKVSGIGSGIQRSSELDKISSDNKKEIQISTASMSGPTIKLADLFDQKKNYVLKEPVKSHTTFSGVNADMQKGLQLYAQTIYSAIGGGSSITRKLDFASDHPANTATTYTKDSQSKLGKTMAYRFTGYKDKSTGQDKVIIEELGEVTSKKPTADEAKNLKERFEKYFSFAVNKKTVNGSDVVFNFTSQEKEQIYQSVALLPDDVLEMIKGVKFLRDDVNPHSSNEAGHYDPNDHSITLYDLTFKDKGTIFGNGTAGFNTGTDQTVVHELAHAVDGAKSKKTYQAFLDAQEKYNLSIDAFNTAVNEYNDLVKKYNAGNLEKSELDKGKEKLDKLEKTMNDNKTLKGNAETAYLNNVSPSGRKMKKEGNTFKEDAAFYVTDFSKAVKEDGNYAATDYGGTDMGESFAESFALYYVDKERFKSLRGKQTEYFDNKQYK